MPSLGRQRVDTARSYLLTLKTTSGDPADLTGATEIVAVLSAGLGSVSALDLAASIADSPEDGKVVVVVPAAPTLEPGEYAVLATATIDGLPIDASSDYTIAMIGGVGTDATSVKRARARLERIVTLDCGPLMSLVGLSTVTGGDNPDLDDVIGWAYRGLGLTPTGDDPSEDELVALKGRIHDAGTLAIYRVLVAVRSRWTQVTTRASQGQANSSDIRQDLDKRLAAMEQMPLIKKAIEIGQPSLTAGGIDMSDMFATCDDDFSVEVPEGGSLHT